MADTVTKKRRYTKRAKKRKYTKRAVTTGELAAALAKFTPSEMNAFKLGLSVQKSL